MSYGLYISAEGAQVQGKRLETIANNLANVDTTGFKRDLALCQARYAEETQQGLDFPGSQSINDVGGGVMVLETRTDFAPGPLKSTNVPTDLAIDGDAFFVIERAGENYLSKAGNFLLRNDGALTTQEGYAVLNDALSPIVLDPLLPFAIEADGSIQQAGDLVNMALVRPESHTSLMKTGENLFRPLAGYEPVTPGERRVKTGFLEMSDVRPTTEMVAMIEASRAFEANVSLIRSQDEMLGSLLSRLLRAN